MSGGVCSRRGSGGIEGSALWSVSRPEEVTSEVGEELEGENKKDVMAVEAEEETDERCESNSLVKR